MKDMTKTERKVIEKNLKAIIKKVDDKTLGEIERLVIGWLSMKRKLKMRDSQ